MHGYKWPINCTRTRISSQTLELSRRTTLVEEQGEHDVVRRDTSEVEPDME